MYFVVQIALRSRPVGYAAEYLTRGEFPAIPMGRFPLMFIYCILYHFWDVRRILLPPPRQIRRDLSTTFSTSIAKQPISTSPTLQHSPFSTHPCGFLRTARPFSVSRYFCRRDRGLSGIVYSSMPSESNISRTDFLNLVLSVLPSLRINSNAEQGIAQPAATRSKTVSTDLPSGLSALTWCPDLVPRLSAPTES